MDMGTETETETGGKTVDLSNEYTLRMLNALARRGYANLQEVSFGGASDKKYDNNGKKSFAIVNKMEALKNSIPDWCGDKDECLKVILARMNEMRQADGSDSAENLPYNLVQYIGDAYNTVNAIGNNTDASMSRMSQGRQKYVNPNIQSKPVAKREWPSDNGTVRMPVGSGFEKGGAFSAIKKMNRQDGINEEDESSNNARMNQYTDMWKPSQEMINGVVDRFGYRA